MPPLPGKGLSRHTGYWSAEIYEHGPQRKKLEKYCNKVLETQDSLLCQVFVENKYWLICSMCSSNVYCNWISLKLMCLYNLKL